MSENLRKLLEYLVQEELDEQNALAAGGVAATSTGLALDLTNFRPAGKKRKENLEEVNSIFSMYGIIDGIYSGEESSSDMEDYVDDPSDPDSKGHGLAKRHKHKTSNKKRSNVNTTIMWSGEDSPGKLPQAKYIALEESVNLRKKQTVKVIVDKQLQQKSFETIIDFIKFTNSILKLNNLPAIYLHTIKKPEMTTGMFNRQTNTLHVLVGKRLIVDVLRTIAHELTHAKQHEAGLLDIHLANIDFNNEMADIDTPYENEAYTLAGNIVKIFCRKYPKITKDELYQLNEVLKKLR